jgi:hypothetical protein
MNGQIEYGKIALRFLALSITCFCLAAFPSAALTAEEATDEPTEIQSFYANPAQAAHAAQLAEQATVINQEQLRETQQAYDTALEDTAVAETELTAAQTALSTAQSYLATLDPTSPDYQAAEAAVASAQIALDKEQQEYATQQAKLATLEDSLTDLLAYDSGLTEQEIQNMRASGLGWGQIAQELGIHPSVLGLGHGKKTSNKTVETELTAAEIAEIDSEETVQAASRNTKNGVANGLNKTTKAQTHSPGTGLNTDSTGKTSDDTGRNGSKGNSNHGDTDNSNGGDNDKSNGGNGKSGTNDKGNGKSESKDKGNKGGNGNGKK